MPKWRYFHVQVIASFDYSGDILKCCIGFGGGGWGKGGLN